MIRMIQSSSAARAKEYFKAALAKADYYISDQELDGFWQGRLAHRLGLDGQATQEQFFALCDNLDPVTRENLTPRTDEERTVGYDINFHCPKSVSILHAFAKDNHILTAFQDSVTETMRVIEADCQTRVRIEGRNENRETSELIWGHFTHQTARPVADQLPDPHLHSHCFVFNATYDQTEDRIKAGNFRNIKRDMPFYQARFHKVLADKMVELGYNVRRTRTSFEIEGVPQYAIDMFSKRTDEIGRIAKEKGITDAKELDELGARTRSSKDKGHSMEDLRSSWLAQVLDRDKGEADELAVRFGENKVRDDLTAELCFDHAMQHCFERASVVPSRKLLEHAYRHGIGGVASVDDINAHSKADSNIINIVEHGREMSTTKSNLKEEEYMVNLAKKGKGKLFPIYSELPDIGLFGQQKTAVEHVLTTGNRVSIIRGAAGVGKTTLMDEAIGLIQDADMPIAVFAPSARASRGVLKEKGYPGAETVAKLLNDEDMQASVKNGVVWVDEAGLLGNQDMIGLLELVERQNARLILGGDTRQHSSVARGDALRVLNTIGGIKSAEVTKVYRQNTKEYREAVEELGKGNMRKGFDKLDKLGFIQEVEPEKINAMLADKYIEAVKGGDTALVVCPTHQQGQEITTTIRERLRSEGMLGKRETTVRQLWNLNMTEAEKADRRNFKDGQIVKFTQNAPGIMRGSLWQVQRYDEKDIRLMSFTEENKPLPFEHSNRFEVFESREIALAKGDKVMITDNGSDLNNKRLNRGDVLDVVGAKKGSDDILLRNRISGHKYQVSKDFGMLRHAHCITSNASQGADAKKVFIYEPTSTFQAASAKQFYVSVSRGKDAAYLFTDNKQELQAHIQHLGDRTAAMELVGKSAFRTEFIIQAQRNEKARSNYQQKQKENDLEK